MSDEVCSQVKFLPVNRSLYTVKLIERMKDGKPGDVLTDEQLEDACGRDCSPSGEGYGNLQSAIRACRREFRVVWRRIREGGAIRCLVAEEIMSGADSDRKAIHRAAKRSVDKLACTNPAELDENGRKRLTTTMAVHGSMALLSKTETVKKLEARNVSKLIDSGKLLECFPK